MNTGHRMSLPVTEDTPPDMLAGSMDLNVVLPNGKSVKMSIQRSTPMMDLLVQVTTAHRLSPGNYSIQAMGERGVLPYKPSTPIGTLDTFTIKIVDKKLNSHKKAPQVPQSFLNTFRLQVNLPRSQLFVARVTPEVTLSEILTHVCTEKNLDPSKYEFRSPGNSEEVLELDKTLGDYKLQELSLINKNNRSVGGLLSSADILHVKSSKHRQNSVCDSSLSSGSLGSRSTSPVPVNLPRIPPQPPIRKKRRPAPKPPQIASEEETKTGRSVLISHSRESSDSSGYHEASVLSESPTHRVPLGRSESSSPPDTLPRHGKLLPSQSFTNLATIQTGPRLVSSASNASLNSNGTTRKKRAAPPPPPTFHPKPEEKMKSSTLPTSRAEERFTSNVPFSPKEPFPETKVENVEKCVESKLEPETKVEEAKPVVEASGNEELEQSDHDSLNWQYQLPPPPSDFRDTYSPDCTEFGTITLSPDIYGEETHMERKDLPEEKKKDCHRSGREEIRQKKTAVMSELTNVLTTDNRKTKSSSVTDLCAEEAASGRKCLGLNYSKSFTNDVPAHLTAHENNRNQRYEREIEYRNHKNLEKSLSMECISPRPEEGLKCEEAFVKPAAPVQRKLAKRSSSTTGFNNGSQQRFSEPDFERDEDVAILRQHFLDFLKEKNLNNELKSLNVIRHILPQINGNDSGPKEERKPPSVKVVDVKRKESAMMQVKIGENVEVHEKENSREEAKPEAAKEEPQMKNVEIRRYSYHAPPAINFATWGERPKTQVFIKDEDYVTEDKVTKKVLEVKKPAEEVQKPVVVKKPSGLQFKKLGGKSHYEMFSALPRKKEPVTSLALIQMEEEERKRKRREEEEGAKEPSRVPVVCGMELKKEFKEPPVGARCVSVTEVNVKPEVKPSHSFSIYINGKKEKGEVSRPRGNLMPVVKGFRVAEEPKFQSHVNINKICSVNGSSHKPSATVVELSPESRKLRHVSEVRLNQTVPPPPPPPPPAETPFASFSLKPVSARQIKPKTQCLDPRSQLMEEIRSFTGFSSHKLRTAQ